MDIPIPCPLTAGNLAREKWESAYAAVFELRKAYPPDSLSSIYRDIAINLQAKIADLEEYKKHIRKQALHEAAFKTCWYCRTGSKHGHDPKPVKSHEGWRHLFWIGNGSNPCSAGPIWRMIEEGEEGTGNELTQP